MVDAAFMDGMDYYGTVGISRKVSLRDFLKNQWKLGWEDITQLKKNVSIFK